MIVVLMVVLVSVEVYLVIVVAVVVKISLSLAYCTFIWFIFFEVDGFGDGFGVNGCCGCCSSVGCGES